MSKWKKKKVSPGKGIKKIKVSPEKETKKIEKKIKFLQKGTPFWDVVRQHPHIQYIRSTALVTARPLSDGPSGQLY